MGKVQSLNISEKKGVKKTPVESVSMVNDFGIDGDAHGGRVSRRSSRRGLMFQAGTLPKMSQPKG